MKSIRHLALSAFALLLAGNLTAVPIPENLSQNGWFIGCQSYTFRAYTAFEAIAKTKQAGGNVIEFYPGQLLKPGSSIKVSHNMPPAAVEELKAECARQGVRAVNYGVVAAKDAAEIQSIMDFAKKMGLYAVTTESTELVADWEKAAIKYDINVGFHEHGKRPGYKVWDPLYILGVVESRDHHLGAAADIGHWCTSGLKPVDCLRILKGRIISLHFKDKAAMGNAPVVVAGKGVVDCAACLAELKKQNFHGNISIEHEADWKNNVPEVTADVNFIKSFGK